jgi:hypothetical protein
MILDLEPTAYRTAMVALWQVVFYLMIIFYFLTLWQRKLGFNNEKQSDILKNSQDHI